MKKLLAIILSLGLIIAPVPASYAAEEGGGGGGYAKVVLGMANGIVGTTILLKCTMGASQPSLILYMAGSVIYAAGEILSGQNKSKSTKENAESINNTHVATQGQAGGDFQRAAVEAQIKNEEANLEHIQKKRKFMMATKVVYTLAAIAAMVEFVLSITPPIYKTDLGGCGNGMGMVMDLPMKMAVVAAYLASQGYASAGIMGAGAALVGTLVVKFTALMTVGVAVANATVIVLNLGLGRIAVFLAAAILVMVIDGSLAQDEERSKKIIEDLKKVLAQFDGPDNDLDEGGATTGGQEGGATAGTTSGAGPGAIALNPTAVAALPTGVALRPNCMAQNNSGMTFNQSNCRNPLRIPRPSFNADMNIPTLTSGTNAAVDMAQALSNGDLAAADVQAGNLAGMAGRIDKLKDELLGKINAKLKSEGKKPIDPSEHIKKQVADLNAALNKEKPGSGNFSFSDLGAEAAVSATIPKEESGGPEVIKGKNDGAAVPSGIDLSKLGESVADLPVDPNAGQLATLDSSLNQFELSEGDISKDKEVSIFKQLSNRYFLNYTKIFQRKEIRPPLAEPAPSKP